jgi:hypothetical protein
MIVVELMVGVRLKRAKPNTDLARYGFSVHRGGSNMSLFPSAFIIQIISELLDEMRESFLLLHISCA